MEEFVREFCQVLDMKEKVRKIEESCYKRWEYYEEIDAAIEGGEEAN